MDAAVPRPRPTYPCQVVLIPVTLLAVLLASGASLLRPRWDVAVLTGLLAAIWSRVNGPVEGRVLHEFTYGRGFTEADVLSVVAVAISVSALLRCTARALGRSGTTTRSPGTTRPAPGPGGRARGAHQGP